MSNLIEFKHTAIFFFFTLFIIFTADRHLCFYGLHMRIQLWLVGKMQRNALLENAFCPPGTDECACVALRNKDMKDGGRP
jgi:hypothetical protein